MTDNDVQLDDGCTYVSQGIGVNSIWTNDSNSCQRVEVPTVLESSGPTYVARTFSGHVATSYACFCTDTQFQA